jgi:ABC transporter substrate binding protein (PQQ-dependent alcohol dehydrogenase system)
MILRGPAAARRRAALVWIVLVVASVCAPATGVAQGDATSTIPVGIVLPAPVAEDDALTAAVRDAAREGARMAQDELAINASVLGYQLDVRIEEAGDAEEAAAIAAAMYEDGVLAVAGGYGLGAAEAIATVAEEHEAVFLNVGSPADRLRSELCTRAAFHVVPSAGMYLDALAGWFVREGFRDWFFVVQADEEGEAQLDRIRWTLRERHFAAREVGVARFASDEELAEAARRAAREAPNLVLVLARTDEQLAFLAQAEEAGIEAEVTGFPWPETQTRAFYRTSGETAPDLGAGFRASAWEFTLDAYGARELNARYEGRFGRPMDAPAWASYMALKIVVESITFGQVEGRAGLREHLASQETVFDVWKGIGVTFRPWNHQLRQSVFLIQVVPDAGTARDRALLVGELPAIYMPRTDPVERLDQLGDLEGASRCRF